MVENTIVDLSPHIREFLARQSLFIESPGERGKAEPWSDYCQDSLQTGRILWGFWSRPKYGSDFKGSWFETSLLCYVKTTLLLSGPSAKSSISLAFVWTGQSC